MARKAADALDDASARALENEDAMGFFVTAEEPADGHQVPVRRHRERVDAAFFPRADRWSQHLQQLEVGQRPYARHFVAAARNDEAVFGIRGNGFHRGRVHACFDAHNRRCQVLRGKRAVCDTAQENPQSARNIPSEHVPPCEHRSPTALAVRAAQLDYGMTGTPQQYERVARR